MAGYPGSRQALRAYPGPRRPAVPLRAWARARRSAPARSGGNVLAVTPGLMWSRHERRPKGRQEHPPSPLVLENPTSDAARLKA